LLPAVLLVHGGPARSSDYLRPLAVRLCEQAGRSCYLYDQLARGMPNGITLKHDAEDLRDVALHLAEHLGEPEVHLLGHGFGGVLIMEAILRRQLWGGALGSTRLPRLRSVCLMGTPSSASILRAEAQRLLRRAQAEGHSNAKAVFWYRHYCCLQTPGCLAEAYPGVMQEHLGGWEPWDAWVLRGWEIRRSELAKRYAESTGSAPLLSVRGEDDFVTEACVEAWRGVRDSLQAAAGGPGRAAARSGPAAGGFREEVIHGCSHHTHLEAPEAFGNFLRQWFSRVEAAAEGP